MSLVTRCLTISSLPSIRSLGNNVRSRSILSPEALPVHHPITLNHTRRNAMSFIPWIPVIIAVLEVVRENMDD